MQQNEERGRGRCRSGLPPPPSLSLSLFFLVNFSAKGGRGKAGLPLRQSSLGVALPIWEKELVEMIEGRAKLVFFFLLIAGCLSGKRDTIFTKLRQMRRCDKLFSRKINKLRRKKPGKSECA